MIYDEFNISNIPQKKLHSMTKGKKESKKTKLSSEPY